ncbi:LytR C-terminal domain-containing protein [Candidatus Gottesmanbacteria bacterium]|nr:LytR C-terminal domain-containing protein [Candidatus Gottesmanbacteria bacterium]
MVTFRVYVLLFLVVVLGCLWVLYFRGTNSKAETLVLLGNPTLVVSRVHASKGTTIISIPSELLFEGVRGYGRYSLNALLKLGIIDHVDGFLVRETLSEALAVPIARYLGYKDRSYDQSDIRPVLRIASFFCGVPCMKDFLLGRKYMSDLSFLEYLQISSGFRGLSESDVQNIDIVEKNIPLTVEESDGVSVKIFDGKRYDALYPNLFEERVVRQEALRVRVANATTMTGIGDRFARKLSRAGALIVAVESSEDRSLERCETIGIKSALASNTARYIQDVYECTGKEIPLKDSRVDLTVRIGSMYEKRYLPLRLAPPPSPRP